MATSLASPTASGGFDGGGSDPNDISAELGQTLQSAIGDSDDTPSGESGTEPSEFTPQAEETPGGEAPTSEVQAPATDEPFPVTEDGNNYLVPKTEFADIKGLREYSTEVQSRFPTVADARIAHEFATDFRSMQYDYESGDPANIDRTLQYWAGANAQDPYTRQRFQESFAVMAQRMPQLLQQINPQAHQQMARAVAQPFIEQAYNNAAMIQDPAEKDAAFRAAQGMDWVLNKSYKTELPKYDPNAQNAQAAQRADQQRLQAIQQREDQLLNRDFSAFDQNVLDGPKIGAVWQEIDKVLAPIKGKYDEATFGEIRAGVMTELVQKLKSDQDWFGTHLQEYQSLKRMFQQAWKSGQDPRQVLGQRAEYYKNDLLVRARRVIPSIAAPRISKATGRTTTVPKATTARPRTQVPPAATPEKNGHYNLRDDSEFQRMFKV